MGEIAVEKSGQCSRVVTIKAQQSRSGRFLNRRRYEGFEISLLNPIVQTVQLQFPKPGLPGPPGRVLLKQMSSPIHSRDQSFGAGNLPFVDAPVQTGGDEIARHAEE